MSSISTAIRPTAAIMCLRALGYLGLIAVGILLWWLMLSPAFAELYVATDVLNSRFAGPKVDGTYKQDLIDGGSDLTGSSLAWGGGLGYRFTDGGSVWSNGWSLEGGYRNWGSVGVGGRWVSDEHYTEVQQHGQEWLSENGIKPKNYNMTDRIEGGYLRVAKGFDLGHGFEVYGSGGVFVGLHTVRLEHARRDVYRGVVAGPTAGGGIKYDLYQGIKLRASVDSHWTFSESEHPISSQWLTVGGGLEVPLKW